MCIVMIDIQANGFYWFLFCTVVLLLVSCLTLIVVLYTRRSLSLIREKKRKDLKFRYQYFLYDALVESQSDQSGKDFYNHMLSFFQEEQKKNGLDKQLLIGIIADLKGSLLGSSREQLLALANALELPEYSLQKLRSSSFSTRAQGLREIGGLHSSDSQLKERVKAIQDSNDAILAQEASLALIKLGNSPDLSFLDTTSSPISQWQQIRLHHHLRAFERYDLPDFGRWLTSDNESVVLFALRMIAEFEQHYASQLIIEQLSHPSANVVVEAIYTIKRLKLTEAASSVAALLEHPKARIQLASIQAVGQLCSATDDLIASLHTFSEHPDYWIRMAASRAISQLKSSGSLQKDTLVSSDS